MSVENSGFKCSYYEIKIDNPVHQKNPYIAECSDIIEALELDWNEANAFKTLWRKAAARQGKKKRNNNAIRDAEKIKYSVDRMYTREIS